MTQHSEPGSTDPSFQSLHLSSDKLVQLPPEELLQACLEMRQLREIIKGVLYTPNSTLILRAVTLDLLFSEAERLSRQPGAGAQAPVTSDIKAVSQRLGIRPASVRQAYEQLDALGGVQILARQFPGRREQQRHLPMDEI
jgi:hypothetical protein